MTKRYVNFSDLADVKAQTPQGGYTWIYDAEAGGYIARPVEWDEVANKPSIYPTDWASVANKPASFPPNAHKSSHEPGGPDALTNLTHASFADANKDGSATTPSLRTLGSGAQQAAAGNHLHDSRYALALTDGTTPLRYHAFYIAAGGNHQTAFQNAINTLFGSGNYSSVLDLEGATITLNAPVSVPTTASASVRYIINGTIRASNTFAGSPAYLLNVLNTSGPNIYFINCVFGGNNRAGWVNWDNNDIWFVACRFTNPNTNGNPGLNAMASGNNKAHYFMNFCYLMAGDGSVPPDQRTRIGIKSNTDDNKIHNSTLCYFKHSIWNAGGTFTLGNCHIYQGLSGATNTTGYTAGIKLTTGMSGSLINGLYLDKCYIEISNQDNPTATNIGGVVINGMTTLSQSADASFAYIVAADYGNNTGCTVKQVVITNCRFTQSGSAQINPTKINPEANFDTLSFDSIIMRDNVFNGGIAPQSNPATVQRTDTSSQQSRSVDFSGVFPFSGKIQVPLSLSVSRTDTTTPVAADFGLTARSGNIQWVRTASSATITATVTATMNSVSTTNGQVIP